LPIEWHQTKQKKNQHPFVHEQWEFAVVQPKSQAAHPRRPETYHQQQAELWRRENKGTGGDPYRTIPVRNGRRFTKAVVSSAFARSLLLRDAGRLLGVNPSKIGRLAQEIGVG